MKSKKTSYSIGLDIGISSVGWACMTTDYRILKYRGNYAIGTREFSSAETAEERRVFRGARRRYNRRIKRIQLLQNVMSPLFQQDQSFFIQTSELSRHFWRNSNQFERHTLSETLRYLGENTRLYPTIYHLRHALITGDEKYHPRLIYLAIHHLVKFRGHFLNENMNWHDGNDSLVHTLQSYLSTLEKFIYNVDVALERLSDIQAILLNEKITNSDKRRNILSIIGKEFNPAISLVLGLKTDMAKLFPTSENLALYKEEKIGIRFTDEDITETYEKLTDAEKDVIDQANIIYQGILLHELLGDSVCVSEAKVKSYQQFGDDLRLLKYLYNKYLGEKKYREMFITSKKNQTAYRHSKNDKLLSYFDEFIKVKKDKGASFYNRIKKEMETLLKNSSVSVKDQETVQKIFGKLVSEQFLQKQKTYFNAAIPHQNNVYEAEIILKNQQKFYPEITDEMIDKTLKIIKFRIPYYIAPLVQTENKGDFGWLIRKKENVPVLPWNIDEVVDRSKSAEKFIKRMTNNCMYLLKESVLPKNSLTYEKFELLNELNGIQIRSQTQMRHSKYRLNKREKAWIIQNVFKSRKNVTHQYLINALKNNSALNYVVLDDETEELKSIYGTQQDNRFNSNLSTYIDMKKIFGEVNDKNYSMIEEIIYWITVFEDKDILRSKIKEKYNNITAKQLQQLLRLNYTGWGRLSKKLLDELPVDKNKSRSMIEIMEDEPKVFMEVLNEEKYDLDYRIAQLNVEKDKNIRVKYADIKELQGSPALKKAIWQAMVIVEELVDLFGEPEHIMIEFAREDGVSGQETDNRKKQINQLEKSVSKDEVNLKKFLKEHGQYEQASYKNQRLYLYITQEGKCLYSGEKLEVTRLQDYEIDHIYPRSFVPDDSIDNLALVKKEMNQRKGDTNMPLQILTYDQMRTQKHHWRKLYDNKLISQKKYFRLMKEEFTAQDKESFFARQLVETRQITKHVKNILEERFEGTEIHTVNANIVTNLRKHSNVLKIRSMNNKHHAIDAAFSALIVQFIINKYGYNFLDFNFKYQEARKKWKNMMKQYGKHFFLFSDIDKYDKFVHFETGEILQGREYLQALNDEIPWQTTKKIGTEEAAFYKQTLHSPKKKQAKYSSDKTATGVYDEMKNTCAYLISYKEENKNGKMKRKSAFVDLYVIEEYQLKNLTKKDLAMFLANKDTKQKVVDAVIHTKINKYQLIEYEGFPLSYISSKEMHNAKQLQLSKPILQHLYKVIQEKEENLSIEYLKDAFKKIVETIAEDYKEYLPASRIEKAVEYPKEIDSKDMFLKGLEELFRAVSASAARSNVFGGRYTKKINPESVKFIHQSATGLQRRKPVSYRHELWSL